MVLCVTNSRDHITEREKDAKPAEIYKKITEISEHIKVGTNGYYIGFFRKCDISGMLYEI